MRTQAGPRGTSGLAASISCWFGVRCRLTGRLRDRGCDGLRDLLHGDAISLHGSTLVRNWFVFLVPRIKVPYSPELGRFERPVAVIDNEHHGRQDQRGTAAGVRVTPAAELVSLAACRTWSA